jgi:3-isopropylmalate dehydrogenase
MSKHIAVLAGDGIGPEVCAIGVQVLARVAELFSEPLRFSEHLIGGAAIDACGEPLPAATLAACEAADAVLLGAVGGPKWSDPQARVRPEQGLLQLRKALGLFANIRPVKPHPKALAFAPIKPELLQNVDFVVVRELTGGIYFGEKNRTSDSASDLCVYQRFEIERIVRMAANLARARKRSGTGPGKLTQVDKANVLETSRLWRAVTEALMHSEFPDISLEHLLVDSAAMHLLSRPASFDVIVTENMFGDILTDEASMLAGSLGLLPSASLGAPAAAGAARGLYEPIHGSAPDIAGRDIANPIATVLSTAMLLRHSLQREQAAQAVERAVDQVLLSGPYPRDLQGQAGCQEMGAAILRALSVSG